MVAFVVVYFTYRQSVSEINSAISKVEEAEREKAETERERRREAESITPAQLAESLEQQERVKRRVEKEPA